MHANTVISNWMANIQELAQSGQLRLAVRDVFGNAPTSKSIGSVVDAWATGDFSVFPKIVLLDDDSLHGHPGAYGQEIDTIFISLQALTSPEIGHEVLTHELAHAIGSQYFSGAEKTGDAYRFTKALLGQDHALFLSASDDQHLHQQAVHADTVMLPGTEQSVSVQWFDTALHIDWARQQMPMLNAAAFDVFKLAQNDSDAFLGPVRLGIFSPYGLQTASATHFDNNNVRGSLEAMRKRWSNGVENFGETSIKNTVPLPFVDSSLVGPNFEGQNAGVENLLYRFGQIAHAFQDFYSHSNWIEMVRAGNDKWISAQMLLDSGLDLPSQLNPGSYLNNAPHVMVSMSGPDFDASLQRAGSGIYSVGPKSVYWWVNDRQNGWGEVFAKTKSGAEIGGLMTGAVNGAVYYDTDYSVPLRAVDRTGFFEKEYYQGFSHGGAAGAVLGQWVSPLSKDKPDNGRFVDKAVNSVFFEDAKAYAALQLRNDVDRMGNLIFKQYGVSGLQKFADTAIVESERDAFVSTYSTAGGRWNWGQVNPALSAAQSIVNSEDVEGSSEHGFHFDENNLRFVEVFRADSQSNFVTIANRSYLTQAYEDGKWFDVAGGLLNTHHDEYEDDGPEAFLPAPIQHAQTGGRALWSIANELESHYLGTRYSVTNVNTQARVYINHVDIGRDVLHIVDDQGKLLEIIDLDHADYAEVRQRVLDTHNIMINARPETEALTDYRVISTDAVQGTVLLQASEFFSDPDGMRTRMHNLASGDHSQLKFAGHDQTRPWLHLRGDGTLEIKDIAQVPKGLHEIYVSVADGAGLLDGAMITIAVDPEVRIAGQRYDPNTKMDVTLHAVGDTAVGLFAQVEDEIGHPVSFMEHLGTGLGQNAGLPQGMDNGVFSINLADAIDHGDMTFYALYYDSNELVELDIRQTGQDGFSLFRQDQIVADMRLYEESASSFIDEIYVNGLEDVVLGIPLGASLVERVAGSADDPHLITIEATLFRESDYSGEFGFFVGDLHTGFLIDPVTGVLREDAGLTPENVNEFSVFSTQSTDSVPVQDMASFSLDPDLNLDNLALFPYYKVDTHEGSQLFLGGYNGTRNGVSHIALVSQNTFGVEDLVRGDYDFDDAVLKIHAISIVDYV